MISGMTEQLIQPSTQSTMTDLAREMFAAQDRLAGRHSGRASLASDLARFVGRIGNRLNRPPRIVLLGEFNSGKSTLANALLGSEILPTSIHANTRVPLLIHYADTPSLSYETPDRVRRPLDVSSIEDLRRGNAHMLHVGLPVARLKSFELIDTPGFASGSSAVDDLILEACRRSHIAVWCTVATQAWKATEQALWAALPRRLHQRGVLAVTHKDQIHSERDRQRLMARLGAEAADNFAGIACVSAIEAQEASREASQVSVGHTAPDAANSWTDSGGRLLESQLRTAIENDSTSRQTSAERLLQRATQRLLAPPSGRLLTT